MVAAEVDVVVHLVVDEGVVVDMVVAREDMAVVAMVAAREAMVATLATAKTRMAAVEDMVVDIAREEMEVRLILVATTKAIVGDPLAPHMDKEVEEQPALHLMEVEAKVMDLVAITNQVVDTNPAVVDTKV